MFRYNSDVCKLSRYLFWLTLGLLVSCQAKPTPTQLEQINENQPEMINTSTPTSTALISPMTITPSWTATPSPISLTPTKTVTVTLTPSAQAQFKMCSPLAEETIPELWDIISDPYNPPPPGRDERHQGVDLAYYRYKDRLTIEGEVIQAILPGKVAAAISNRLPYGNMIMIETASQALPAQLRDVLDIKTGESLYHLYAHMQAQPLLSLGDTVSCGEPLGTVGKTGYNIVNPHLHLETRIGPSNAMFESMAFYDTSATVEEMNNYKLWRTSGTFRHFDPMTLFQLYLDMGGE